MTDSVLGPQSSLLRNSPQQLSPECGVRASGGAASACRCVLRCLRWRVADAVGRCAGGSLVPLARERAVVAMRSGGGRAGARSAVALSSRAMEPLGQRWGRHRDRRGAGGVAASDAPRPPGCHWA